MRTAIALLISFLAAPAFALNVWFDPRDPNAQTAVTAHVAGTVRGCGAVTNASYAVSYGDRNVVAITLAIPGCTSPTDVPVDVAVNLGALPAGVYDVVVGQEGILIGLGQATLAVRDANPTYSVMPNVGSIAGGDAVQILGPNITFPCPGSGPLVEVCWPTIYIGDVVADRVPLPPHTNSMTVRTPPHAAGPVDVRIVWPMGMYRLSAAFDYYDPEKVPDAAYFTPVLFPVVFAGDGAYGAKWQTEVSLYNGSDSFLDTAPLPRLFSSSSYCPFDVPNCDFRPAPHAASQAYVSSYISYPRGYLMYVPRVTSSQLSFGARVRDLSRQSQDLGTQIPVVREKDFFAGKFSILNVPIDSRYRITLRAFRLDGNTLRLRIWRIDGMAPIIDTPLALSPATAGMSSTTINDLVGAYPELSRAVGMVNVPLRIELDSEGVFPGSWGFVSITNNDTQHVTVISPQ